MDQRVVTAVAIIAGAVLIPLALWRIVGDRRQRDPLLLPLGIIATAFAVAGVGEMIVEGETWKLVLGALGLVGFAIRWRALTPKPPAV
jgi:hypothetical protein